MGRRDRRVLAVTFERRALDSIIQAAAESRAVVVEHSLDPTSFDDDHKIELIAAGRPDGWMRTVDATMTPLPGIMSQPVDVGMPSVHDKPVVARLLHLQRSSELRWLTDAVYDELESRWPASEPWSERDASMLVASPGAVTSAHSDEHHNLLVQLTGSKEIVIVEPGTPEHAATVSQSFPGMRVAEMPEGARTIELEAGQALYVPPYTVHWVRSSGRAVAMTCGWRTPATERAGQVYAGYATLQRLGVRPRPVGGRLDAAVIPAARVARRVRSLAARH